MDLVGRVGRSRVLPPPEQRRELRRTLGIEQQELAAELGVSVQTVWAWETGRSIPAGENRQRYADALASMAATVNDRGEAH